MGTIFYSNHNQNSAWHTADILKKGKLGSKHTFHPLSLKESSVLTNFHSRGIMIWGSGSEHDWSYFFDYLNKGNRKKIVKVGLDQHLDVNSLCEDSRLNYANHMRYSAQRKGHSVRLIIPKKCYAYPPELYDPSLDIKLLPPSKIIETLSDKRIQLTIDLDCINLFPTEPGYLIINAGFSQKRFFEIIEILSKLDIVRLDVGGIWIPPKEWDFKTNIYGGKSKYRSSFLRRIYSDENIRKATEIIERIINIFENLLN
ncbi:hypothetical protein KO465_00905 [Candidatus Micrarchaeota archaeon]|nr:hypothetical protein [Candidatus Micrarchaeota archaeon]